MQYAVRAQELHVSYEKKSILWDLSFEVPKGVIAGIFGPNGAGKSTLLKTILGLLKPLHGSVEFGVQSIAYVPQRESVDWDFPITAKELVLMGRFGKLGLFGRLKKADKEAAVAALAQVGMEGYAHVQISQLSGGQQQRLFIARALVQGADILLLDEPFAGVDVTSEKEIMALLKKQKEMGKTILIVHHDLASVTEYFDWALLLNTRLIASGGVAEVFTRENLVKAFGKGQSLFDEALELSAKSFSGQRA